MSEEFTVRVHGDGSSHWYERGSEPEGNGNYVEQVVKIDADGNKFWYLHGKLHRENGPAIEWADGDKDFYENGKYGGTMGRLLGMAVSA